MLSHLFLRHAVTFCSINHLRWKRGKSFLNIASETSQSFFSTVFQSIMFISCAILGRELRILFNYLKKNFPLLNVQAIANKNFFELIENYAVDHMLDLTIFLVCSWPEKALLKPIHAYMTVLMAWRISRKQWVCYTINFSPQHEKCSRLIERPRPN